MRCCTMPVVLLPVTRASRGAVALILIMGVMVMVAMVVALMTVGVVLVGVMIVVVLA